MTRDEREQDLRRIAARGEPGVISLTAILQRHNGGNEAAPPDAERLIEAIMAHEFIDSEHP